MNRLMLIAFFMLFGSVAIRAQVGSNACDPELWSRVYSRYRFERSVDPKNKKEPPHRCVQIRGRIDHVTPVTDEGDGDIHISIVPDNKGVLRAGQRLLALEIICADNTPAIGPAKTPCKGYRIPPHLSYGYIKTLKKGQRVEVIGELVDDYYHRRSGLAEIHPVTRIKRIR